MSLHEYTLRKDDHCGKQMSELYYFFMTSDMTDCIFIVEKREIKVHKVILAAASPYFKRIFIQKSKYGTSSVHEFSGISFEELNWIIKYIYTGCIKLNGLQLLRFKELCKHCEINMSFNNIVAPEDPPVKPNECVAMDVCVGNQPFGSTSTRFAMDAMDTHEESFRSETASFFGSNTSSGFISSKSEYLPFTPPHLPVADKENIAPPALQRCPLIRPSKFTKIVPKVQVPVQKDQPPMIPSTSQPMIPSTSQLMQIPPYRPKPMLAAARIPFQDLQPAATSSMNQLNAPMSPDVQERPKVPMELLILQFHRKRQREKAMKSGILPKYKKLFTVEPSSSVIEGASREKSAEYPAKKKCRT